MRSVTVGLVLLVSVARGDSRGAPANKAAAWVEMSVEDVFQVEGGGSHIVVLRARDDGRLLPIGIGEAEALAISLRLAKQHPPRPLTHDLLERMLALTGGQVVKIHIIDLRESTFIGRVFLRWGGRTLDIDARPSDSIALALGARAPIFAARKVLDQAGVEPNPEDGDEGAPPSPPSMQDLLRRARQRDKGTSI